MHLRLRSVPSMKNILEPRDLTGMRIVTIPAVLLFGNLQKFLIAGLTTGGVKE
jgi:ABC-type glycerol-3-phosphate transport system permease component